MFFTATWPREVQKIADIILRNPVEIKIGNPNVLHANKDVEQIVKIMSQDQKYTEMKNHLKKLDKD
jgi:superfamily II DNA/RNA helicase